MGRTETETRDQDGNHGNLGDLADCVSSQSSAGDVLQFTSTDGGDEVQVVRLIQLVPQVLHTHTHTLGFKGFILSML